MKNNSNFNPKSEGVHPSPDGKKWLVVIENKKFGGRKFSTHSQHTTKELAEITFNNLKQK